MAVSVRIPRVFVPLAKGGNPRRAVIHATLDCRIVDTLLAILLAKKGEVMLIAPSIEDARWRVEGWLKGQPRVEKSSVGRVRRYRAGSSVLWLVPEGEGCPARDLDAVAIVDAGRMAENPLPWVEPRLRDGADIIVAGAGMPDAEHWLRGFALEDGADTFMVPAREILAEFPDQAAAVDENHPAYRRNMLLEDVGVETPPFVVFSRERLRIRSAKPRSFFSPRQLAEVEGQPKSKAPVVSLDLSRLQRRYFAMKRLGRRRGFRQFITVKYRRGGITAGETAWAYRDCTTFPGTQAMFLADTDERTRRIFSVVLDYQKFDPHAPATLGVPTEKRIRWANASQFYTATAGGKGARGEGFQLIHWTEVPYAFSGPNAIVRGETLLSGLIEAASGDAEITLEGTPFGRELFYQTYREAKDGLNDFWPIFLRWFDDDTNRAAPGAFKPEEIRETLTEEEGELVERFGLDMAQVAFRRKKKREHRGLFDQEFPEDDERCFMSHGACYFDKATLFQLLRTTDEGVGRHVPGGVEHIWQGPVEGKEYVIGVDTSEGVPGCDPCGLGVLRKDNLEQVASVHGIFKPRVLAEHIVRLAGVYATHAELKRKDKKGKKRKVTRPALVGVERENHGHAVLEALDRLGFGAPHDRGGPLYHFKPGRAGWSTNAETRPLMAERLADALEEGHLRVRDQAFVGECLTFILGGGGKFEAAPGAHDDRVMKWAIALAMRNVRRRRARVVFTEGRI